MEKASCTREIYVVVSQTGTILSRILHVVTGAEYNHASIGMDDSMRIMYSFGRLNPYNPVVGGFVKESPYFGTFRRFYKTRAVILRIPVTQAQHDALSECLTEMYRERHKYRFDILGLFLAAAKIRYKRENCYYCSDFVREMLCRFGIADEGAFDAIVKPVDFLEMEDKTEIYRGILREYAAEKCKIPV